MVKGPKISVVIPVYNVADYLSRCLESLRRQTLLDIEIICVNDGSTDNSLSLLNKYASLDKRIKIIQQENKGLSCARNIGLDYSTGEYILFVDSDDELEINAIENLYKGKPGWYPW